MRFAGAGRWSVGEERVGVGGVDGSSGGETAAVVL